MMLCVLGGSGHSTPVLIDALARAVPITQITVRLAGRNRAHLQAVTRACNLLSEHTDIHTEFFAEDRWDRALTGSDVVLIQARIGGYAARAFDESFSLPFGVPGDEGLGPGGLSAAYRSWPQMRDLFEQVRAAAPPRAQVILLSSPVSLLVRMAALAYPGWPLVGTCELPGSTLDHICAAAGVGTDHVNFGYTGVNHLGFVHHVYASQGSESDDLVMRYAGQHREDTFPSSDLINRLGAFPLKYLRLHFAPQDVVAEQRRRPTTRAEDLALLAEHSFSVFREGDAAAIRHALSARRTDWYELAVLPLLLSHLHLPVARPQFLTIADADGEVRERAYAHQHGTFKPLPQAAPAPHACYELVNSFIDYERAGAEAVLSGSVSDLADALAVHPSLPNRHARALADAIVDQPFARNPDQERELCRI